ncbi:MAG TPA: SDR family NAD(P)-dependent oxidoreductase [Alphaproteobacteria bacterium]|jgi:2-deoxy-D-gluconate 3-dehydrogenase|nr:SDR family NAD(P)-dependent oxidoreductase [Alphaproteobacteria bacterium]
MAALDLFGLEGKKALVVGGGQGMGESSARLLAQAGCDVAIVDVLGERAERVAGVVRDIGRKSVAIEADVLTDGGAVHAVAEAEKQLGGIDVLVTIVGQALFTPLVDLSPEDWDFDQRRNLRYFFVVGREVARSMIARGTGGSMVCIASTDGMQGAPFHAAYGAAKAGLIQLVKSMAVEWAEKGIRVNSVAPGSISTPRLPDTEGHRAAMKASLVPMEKSGTTDDIGKAVLFLASDMSAYTTGHTLMVDGGWMAANLFDARKMGIKQSTENRMAGIVKQN